jgi:hypothetical protein
MKGLNEPPQNYTQDKYSHAQDLILRSTHKDIKLRHKTMESNLLSYFFLIYFTLPHIPSKLAC